MTAGSVIRDQNRIPIWWGVSSIDGVTLVPIAIDSVSGKPLMEIGTSTMAVMSAIPSTIPREENRIPALAGLSTDTMTIIPISVNPATGAIQAQTT